MKLANRQSKQKTTTSISTKKGKMHRNIRNCHPKSKQIENYPNFNIDMNVFSQLKEEIPVPNTARTIKRKNEYEIVPLSSRVSEKNSVNLHQKVSHNPLIKNGPISPELAKQKYSLLLNTYEIEEIDEFQDIYFLGVNEVKIHPNRTGASNYGYDDRFHHYKAKIGDHIAYRFEIRSILGKGAFGQVLRCIDHKTNDLVALKMIVNTPVMQEQGKTEASILQFLNEAEGHEESGILQCTDYFIFRNHICLTSEILGLNLYDMSKKMHFKPFAMSKVRGIAKDILIGLEFIHSHSIVHCDIKPENILLCPEGKIKAKIIDFGSSCVIGEQKFEYIQSRYYRAPEVILGLEYGPPMDIWSFACIIAEMLLGRPLFSGDNEEEQMRNYMEVFGRPPNELIDNCSRRKHFFDDKYRVISHSGSKKHRKIGSISLAKLTRFQNSDLLDLLEKCFEWDQEKRITASEALNHPFFTVKTPRIQCETSSNSGHTGASKEPKEKVFSTKAKWK